MTERLPVRLRLRLAKRPPDAEPYDAAGWLTDPLDPARQRWWDGKRWTDRTC